MKTTEFLVEYEGIGDDAAAMHAENEVQECRQKCYQAAKHAIKLHKMLQDVADTHDLEDWVLEKLTQAAGDLQEVSEHMEYESYSKDEFELSQPDFDQSFDDHFPEDETLLSLGEESNPVAAMSNINHRLQANKEKFKNQGADAARKDLMRITKARNSNNTAWSFPLSESEFEYGNMDPKDVYADLGRKMLEVNKIYSTASDEKTLIAARKALMQLFQRRERARKEMEASKAGNVRRGEEELSLQAMAGNPLPHTRGFTETKAAGSKKFEVVLNGNALKKKTIWAKNKTDAKGKLSPEDLIKGVKSIKQVDEVRRTNIGNTLARKVDQIERMQGKQPTRTPGVMAHDDGFGPKALSPAAQKRADIKAALKKSGMEEDAASDDREMKAGMNDQPAQQRPTMAPASRSAQQAAVKKANQSASDSLDFTEGEGSSDENGRFYHTYSTSMLKDLASMCNKHDPEEVASLKLIKAELAKRKGNPERIAEISQATKDRYVARASSEHGMANFGAQVSNKPAEKKAFAKERDKRAKGIRLALTGKSIQQEDATGGASCSGAVAAVVSPLGARTAPKAKTKARSFKNSIKSPKVKMGKGIY